MSRAMRKDVFRKLKSPCPTDDNDTMHFTVPRMHISPFFEDFMHLINYCLVENEI
jgi:hypothetical protein